MSNISSLFAELYLSGKHIIFYADVQVSPPLITLLSTFIFQTEITTPFFVTPQYPVKTSPIAPIRLHCNSVVPKSASSYSRPLRTRTMTMFILSSSTVLKLDL